jgi:hypothetical protein
MQFNVTKHPSSAWVIQQLREAFPYDSAPDYLILDRGPQFNDEVIETVKSFGIRPKRTSFRSPWQNGVAERWVGSCRRDLLDHVIVVNERHLKRLMNEYVHYYHEDRTHLALAKGTPAGRETGMRPVDGCKPVSIQDSVVCIIATTWSPELSLRPILNGSENSRRETCAYQPRILCFVRFSLRSSGTERLHSGR